MGNKWNFGSHSSRAKRKKRNWKLPIIAVAIVAVILVAGLTIYYYEYHMQAVNGPAGTNIGDKVPNFTMMLADGTNTSLSSYYNSNNHPILLWFVTTWSSYCQDGLQSLASTYYSQLNAKGVTILVVELYDNLGKPAPTLVQTADKYAGGTNMPGLLYGTMNQNVTLSVDPGNGIDVFYLLSSSGVVITFGYGSPAYDFILTKV